MANRIGWSSSGNRYGWSSFNFGPSSLGSLCVCPVLKSVVLEGRSRILASSYPFVPLTILRCRTIVVGNIVCSILGTFRSLGCCVDRLWILCYCRGRQLGEHEQVNGGELGRDDCSSSASLLICVRGVVRGVRRLISRKFGILSLLYIFVYLLEQCYEMQEIELSQHANTY